MKRIISLLTLTLLLFSCNSDNFDLSNEDPQNANIENPNYKVSQEEAIERLKTFLNENKSKATSSIRIQNIEVLTKGEYETRSFSTNIPDTLMYAINLSNNEGFALMSADNRTAPIFALVEKGNYSFKNDTINNPGFKLFMEMAKNYIAEMTTKTDVQYTKASISNNLSLSLEEENGPKLLYEWGQGNPYNMYTEIRNGKQSPVGCVAVAIGMSTAYFSPSGFNINGYSISFKGNHYTTSDLLKNKDAAQNVARFLREIGRNVNMNYGEKESLASGTDAEKFLKNESKIKNVIGFKNYGDDKTVSYIYQCLRLNSGGGVVIMGGNNSNGEGHMWVIDGIRTYNVSIGNYMHLYHCNWGWDGTNNGWYLQTIFTYNNAFISGGSTSDAPVRFPINIIYSCLSKKAIY